MNRFRPVYSVLVVAYFGLLDTSPMALASEPNVPPNIILILSDDHGFHDYGFMGSKIAKTPNIDRVAAESLVYTRGYVMPVCSPSLACLLTGQLPHVHGITGNDLSPAALKALKIPGQKDRSPLSDHLLANPMILPQALSKAGYRTFQSGKLWNVTAKQVGFTNGMTNKEGRHGGDGLTIGRNSMAPIFDFIKSASDESKPFFVWYAPMMPHQPHNPPQTYLKKYQNRGMSANAEKYYAMVEWFDQTCGELDEFLKKNNHYENTMIVYLADNGWDAEQGSRAKLSPYELGIRTPIFVRWPGKMTPARDDETLASIVDIVPTMLIASGLQAPKSLPGCNLLDRDAMKNRKEIFVEGYTHDIHDLAHPEASLVSRVVINGWSKLLLPGANRPDKAYTSAPTEVELFDLKSDPYEKQNLAKERPEEVNRLKAILDATWSLTK